MKYIFINFKLVSERDQKARCIFDPKKIQKVWKCKSIKISLKNWMKKHRKYLPMFRRDSMISTFRMVPVASGHGLCDIDIVKWGVYSRWPSSLYCPMRNSDQTTTGTPLYYSELLNHVSWNWEVVARRKYTDNLAFSILIIIGVFSPCHDVPMFDTWFTVNNTLAISAISYHTVRWLLDSYEMPKSLNLF